MKNKTIPIIAAFLIIFSTLFLFACNKEEQKDITEGFTFSKQGQEYVVTGYSGISEIIVPALYKDTPVTAIARGAFRGSNLSKVTISEGIKTISDHAFAECFGLYQVNIPKTVTTIGEEVFIFCTSLSEIIVSQNNPNYKSVDGNLYSKNGAEMWAYCLGNGKKSFSIPEGTQKIRSHIFAQSPFLDVLTLPSTLTEIGDAAFASTIISQFDVHENNSVFSSDEGVLYTDNGATLYRFPPTKDTGEDIHLKTGLKKINKIAFADTQIKRLFINEELEEIGERAFLRSDLEEVSIPASVQNIGTAPFEKCVLLLNIIVDDNNTKYQDISGNLYNKSGNIFISYPAAKENQTFNLPRGITEIAESAFYSATLERLEIPSTVTTIGDYGLNSPYIRKIIIDRSAPPTINENTFSYLLGSYTVYVPNGVAQLYQNYNQYWEKIKDYIREFDDL